MKEIKYIIKDNAGIHARPAGLLVKLVKETGSDVTVTKNDKTVDAKKLLAVMSLGVKKDEEIIINISGGDEDNTQKQIQEFLENNL